MGNMHGHSHSHGHSHGADAHEKMLRVVVNGVSCYLTAHLSKSDGNELDVMFAGAAQLPLPLEVSGHLPVHAAIILQPPRRCRQPLTRVHRFLLNVQMTSIDGVVMKGSDTTKIVFEPAPAEERPAGEAGGCSHFVAKTPFMDPSQVYRIVIQANLTGRCVVEIVWDDFSPSKFAHHVE